MSNSRYRVLVIAEAANPEWASVPLIGWSLSRALAKRTDALIATHVRNRDAFVRAGMSEGRDFIAIDNEYVARPLWWIAERLRGGSGKGWTTATAFASLSYYSFELELWRRLKPQIKAGEFDLVHRITPLSPTSQSPIASRLEEANVPFIIGPLNGGLPWPKGFLDRQHTEREWLAHIRGLYKLMPSYRATRQKSAAIIVGSRHTLNEMPRSTKAKLVYIPENGVDLERFAQQRDHRARLPLRVAFVGRLVPYKGADLLLEATAHFQRGGQLKLDIVGDGPQRPELEELVDRLCIRNSVRFHGWVPHDEIQSRLRVCDLLALPSVREFGGGVVMEAMALGLAVLVADYGGPSEIVDDQVGLRIPFRDRGSLVKGTEQAIGKLILDPALVDKFGDAGRRKVVARLTWQQKATQILQVYEAVLCGSKDLSNLAGEYAGL